MRAAKREEAARKLLPQGLAIGAASTSATTIIGAPSSSPSSRAIARPVKAAVEILEQQQPVVITAELSRKEAPPEENERARALLNKAVESGLKLEETLREPESLTSDSIEKNGKVNWKFREKKQGPIADLDFEKHDDCKNSPVTKSSLESMQIPVTVGKSSSSTAAPVTVIVAEELPSTATTASSLGKQADRSLILAVESSSLAQKKETSLPSDGWKFKRKKERPRDGFECLPGRQRDHTPPGNEFQRKEKSGGGGGILCSPPKKTKKMMASTGATSTVEREPGRGPAVSGSLRRRLGGSPPSEEAGGDRAPSGEEAESPAMGSEGSPCRRRNDAPPGKEVIERRQPEVEPSPKNEKKKSTAASGWPPFIRSDCLPPGKGVARKMEGGGGFAPPSTLGRPPKEGPVRWGRSA
ncbi:unnamed protein product [Linum trigynum]|uniref:Uncharacterized protein n=1 Tax=Linum trigynum TaxID=586398 RepID=A0AAV2GT35_9ROSI